MRYRLLIFDFDGTLADSFPRFLEQMRQTGEHFGLRPIDEETLEALRSLGAREIIRYLGIPAWKVPLVARFMRRLMAADLTKTRLFPGMDEMLSRLVESGYQLAIVSSNAEANIRAVLGTESAGRIGAYACGASLFGKAAKFRKVLKLTGVPASQALTIGDEIRDFESAREAGLDFGAVAWGYTKVEALENLRPAFVFRRPEEILEAALGIAKL